MNTYQKFIFSFVLMVYLLLTAFVPKQDSAATLLKKVYKNYRKHTSMTYNVLFRHRFLTTTDTVTIRSSCKLIADDNDTLFGGILWYSASANHDRYYDLNTVYHLDHATKVITDYGDDAGFINGNITGDVIQVDFLNPERLLEYSKDSSLKLSVTYDKGMAHVTIVFPDEPGFTESIKKYSIRIADCVITNISYQVKFMGDYQYSEWTLSDIAFDKVKRRQLKNEFIEFEKTYKKEIYKEPTPEDLLPLPAGVQAPDFTGTVFQDNTVFSLSQYRGKYVILDFSYMACHPCIQAIPHMNKLYNDFKDKNVLVAAVNSGDNHDKAKERIPDFIKKHNLNYPMILTNRSTDSLYLVKGYPTLFAISPDGNIVYSSVGFSEAVADTLYKIIK